VPLFVELFNMSKQSGNPHSFKQSGRQSWRKIVLTEVFRILESEGSLQRLPAHLALHHPEQPQLRVNFRGDFRGHGAGGESEHNPKPAIEPPASQPGARG
jgi:hypothetical protein